MQFCKSLPAPIIGVAEDFSGLFLSPMVAHEDLWNIWTLEGCFTLINWWLMKIYDVYGLYGWNEHAALAQIFLEADYLDNHFTVAIGIALNPKPQTLNWKPMEL